MKKILFSLLMGIYYICFCFAVAFIMRFLQEKGFTNPEIAAAAMFSAIACLAAQPIWANLCDKGISIRVLILSAVLLTAGGCFLLTYSGQEFYIAAVAAAIMALGTQAVPGLVDAWGVKLINQGVKLSYGKARSVGSFTYAATCILFGILLDYAGMRVTPWLMLAAAVPLAVILWMLPEPEPVKSQRADFLMSARALWKHPTYKFYTLAMFLSMLSMASYISFFPVFMTELGGTNAHIGWAYSLMALMEVAVMPHYGKLRKRFGTRRLFIVSVFGSGVKNLAIAAAFSPVAAILAFITQAVAGALNFPAVAGYVEENIDRKWMATAQVLLNALGLTLGMVVANLFIGQLSDAIGVRYMLLLMALPSFAGGIMLWATTRKRRETV